MTTYKGINGTSVVNYAGDLPNAIDGQVWYDSTAADFKYQYPNVTSAGAWSTGGSLNTARDQLAGCGTQTAALAFGGTDGNFKVATEEYDGSSWTNGGSMLVAIRKLAGSGTQTAGFQYGGQGPAAPVALSQQYDGTSWVTSANLGTARYSLDGLGETQAGSMAFGGGPALVNTEEFTGETTAVTAKSIDFD